MRIWSHHVIVRPLIPPGPTHPAFAPASALVLCGKRPARKSNPESYLILPEVSEEDTDRKKTVRKQTPGTTTPGGPRSRWALYRVYNAKIYLSYE
jgi:hypothetical protein